MTMKQKKQALFDEIKEDCGDYLGFGEYPTYGQILLSGYFVGMPYDFDHAIGFAVQIRKGRGQYSSAQYLMRCADGSLVNHENQGFFVLSESLSERVLEFFEILPENEDRSNIYTINGEFPESGYIIEHKAGDPVGNSPAFGVIITGDK